MIVTLAVILFAVGTGICWSVRTRATEELFGGRAVSLYRWAHAGFFCLGSILSLRAMGGSCPGFGQSRVLAPHNR